jgi:hypothetical protein
MDAINSMLKRFGELPDFAYMYLNVAKNTFGGDQLITLANLMEDNVLHTLILRDCRNLVPDDAVAIGAILLKNFSIQHLDYGRNRISQLALEQIVIGLKENFKIEELCLSVSPEHKHLVCDISDVFKLIPECQHK